MDEIGKVKLWGAIGAQPQRKARRASMFLQADVSFGGAQPVALHVRNLGPGGMMLECDAPPAEGTRIEATVRGLELVTGVVAWVKPGSAGIAFDTEIDPLLATRRQRRSVDPEHLVAPTSTRSRRPKLKPN